MTLRTNRPAGRIRVISRDEFYAFKEAAKRASQGEGRFADKVIIAGGRPKTVSHPAFSFVIFDQNRMRGISLEHKPVDENPTVQSVITLSPTDQFLPFFYGLYLLLQKAFPQKDIGQIPPSIIHLCPKPIFDEAFTDLLAVHNALSLAIVYADGIRTELTDALRTLAGIQISNDPKRFISFIEQPNSSFNQAVLFLRSYSVITEILSLIADKE